jgi:hypothetical protein
MKSYEERVEEAQTRIVPILKELQLDIAGHAYLEDGKILARPVYVDQVKSEAPTTPPVEETKTIDEAIAAELQAK